MRALRIFVNNIELDYVREDAKFRDENSSFYNSIKVPHTTRPIRIVENKAAVEALGEFSITAKRKTKFFPCVVYRGANRFNGILTQNSKIRGFRKCDVKYGSELNGIMDKKIAGFFPTTYLKGEIPFTEESDTPFEAEDEWLVHSLELNGKIFPEVKYQFPQMRYEGKFGTDLDEEDSRYWYQGYINYRAFAGLMYPNTGSVDEDFIHVNNLNVYSPQVFMLSPIYYAFQSIGYVMRGNVVTSPFFKRLMLLNFKDNHSKVVLKVPGTAISLDGIAWEAKGISWVGGPNDSFPFPTYVKEQVIQPTSDGNFVFRYKLTMDYHEDHLFGIQIARQGELLGQFQQVKSDDYTGELTFDVVEGEDILIRYYSVKKAEPSEYEFEFAKNLPDKDFFDAHPTIDFSRYLPDWTVAEYMNNFKQLFNWRIDIDDVKKEVSLNFNEADYLINGDITPIRKSLKISDPENIEAESYILKYENDEDDFQFISRDLVEKNREGDEETEVIPTKFKYVPHQSGSAWLSENLEDRDGEGLMLYSPNAAPFTQEAFNGQTLKITGQGGIYETYWRAWISFKLNASKAILKGPFTHTELFQIGKTRKIYIDHQLWLVKALEYKETPAALFETEIEVESVSL